MHHSPQIDGEQLQVEDYSSGLIRELQQRFINVQIERLKRVSASLQPMQQAILDVLPILFHYNHQDLPCFVAGAPSGFLKYHPHETARKSLNQFARGFSCIHLGESQRQLFALYAMGSTGTIAHSVKSDFDLWLCHHPEMNESERFALETKSRMVERWAAQFNLEVHIFLVNAHRFCPEDKEELNEEHAGTAMHYLLLDEFYRTGLCLAGTSPLWWFVPAEQEANYTEWTEDLISMGLVDRDQYLDFGGVHHVPVGEFVGAALWQLYKAIDSPYKSILKLQLIELYARQYDELRLLSLDYKHAIYQLQLDIDHLDPYLMLYDRLEQFFQQQRADERLELTRKALYFKVNIPLSRNRARSSWRRMILERQTRLWDWTSSYISLLDNRDTWGIKQALRERQELRKELQLSYRYLLSFTQSHDSGHLMNQNDLAILGRKLFSHFERKPGKVDIINQTIAPNLSQEKITLHELPARQKNHYLWAAYVDLPLLKQEKYPPPLKYSTGFIETLVWCHLNGLLTGHLHIPIFAQRSILSDFEVKELISNLRQLLPNPMPSPSEKAFSELAYSRQVLCFVNVGVDPMEHLTRKGLQKISSRTDSLDYSALRENLIRTIDCVTLNSWHEVLCNRFDDDESVVKVVVHLFSQVLKYPDQPLPEVRVLSFSSGRAAPTAKRVEQLLHHMLQTFDRYRHRPFRYLMRVERRYYLFTRVGRQFHYQRLDHVNELYEAVSHPQKEFSPIAHDAFATADNYQLQQVLARATRSGVQVFYQANSEEVELYVMDEKSALIRLTVATRSVKSLLTHLYRFLRTVEFRQMQEGERPYEAGTPLTGRRISFFEIVAPKRGEKAWLRPWKPSAELDQAGYAQISAEVHQEGNTKPEYTLYIDGDIYSEAQLGEDYLSLAAEQIISMRSGQEFYPAYITDLQFSEETLLNMPEGGAASSVFLRYKDDIESQLHSIMRAMYKS